MAIEKLYSSQKLFGAIYRAERERNVEILGYGISKTQADRHLFITAITYQSVQPIHRCLADRGEYERWANLHRTLKG